MAVDLRYESLLKTGTGLGTEMGRAVFCSWGTAVGKEPRGRTGVFCCIWSDQTASAVHGMKTIPNTNKIESQLPKLLIPSPLPLAASPLLSPSQPKPPRKLPPRLLLHDCKLLIIPIPLLPSRRHSSQAEIRNLNLLLQQFRPLLDSEIGSLQNVFRFGGQFGVAGCFLVGERVREWLDDVLSDAGFAG